MARLAVALSTPSTASKALSTRLTQEAQCIPSTPSVVISRLGSGTGKTFQLHGRIYGFSGWKVKRRAALTG